jgi:hypothetical protein
VSSFGYVKTDVAVGKWIDAMKIQWPMLMMLLVGLLFVGCSRHSSTSSASDHSFAQVVASLTLIKYLNEGDVKLAQNHLSLLDESALKKNVGYLLAKGSADEALGMLNQAINLWIVSECGNTRPTAFPDPSDGPAVLSFLADLASTRETRPVKYSDPQTAKAIKSVLEQSVDVAPRSSRQE